MRGQLEIEPTEIASFDVIGLSARISFNPDEGRIWLQNERMLLLHLGAVGALRSEIIEKLGIPSAREMLFRLGHASGSADAALAREGKPHMEVTEAFMAGPRLHAIEGMAAVETLKVDVDPESGTLSGEWIWRNSAEVEAHLDHFGLSAEPVCWILVGYASAFTSAFMGRPIIFREVECKATGAPHCRVIAMPADSWDDYGGDQSHFDIELSEASKPMEGDWALSEPETDKGVEGPDRLVGISPAFVTLMHQVKQVAPTDAAVLLIGETGVGKKSSARLIHQQSKRAQRPFQTCNCSTLSGEYLQVELFGIEKSGPNPGRQGQVEKAAGGTLFLEDVHCLDALSQARLLSLLQNQSVDRLGGGQSRRVDVRIIASTDEQLLKALRDGSFRRDLYYRLAVMPINVPPLRERRNDLPFLIRHYLQKHARRLGGNPKRLTHDAVRFLLTHDFGGNITELESMFERAMILTDKRELIGVSDLALPTDFESPNFLSVSPVGKLIQRSSVDSNKESLETVDGLLDDDFDLEVFETQLIDRAVEKANGNLSKAAKLLGLTRPQLAYRYRKLHVP